MKIVGVVVLFGLGLGLGQGVRQARADVDAPTLLARGAQLERDRAWIQARRIYEQLAAVKAYEGQALYLQAWTAFQAGDDDAALRLATRATKHPGPHVVHAQALYGDALFRRGEHQRAKTVFVTLYANQTGDARTIAAAKVAATNRALGLSRTEGLTTPPASRPSTRTAPAPNKVPARTALELRAAGKAHERAGEWHHARQVYEQLEQLDGHAGEALFLQGRSALAADELDEALSLAAKAVMTPGGPVTDAKFLYGDVLFRMGEYRRARDVFVQLVKSTAAAPRATAVRKVAAANKQLKLPASDGLPR